MCRHWAAATTRVQALGFLRSRHWCFLGAGIGVFAVAALVFLGAGIGVFVGAALVFLGAGIGVLGFCAGIGVFVVVALVFLRSWHWCFCGRGIGARRPP